MNELTHSTLFKQTTLNLDLTYRLAVESDIPKLEWMGEYTHFRKIFQYTYEEQKHGRRLMLIADCNHFPIGQIFMLMSDFWEEDRGYLYSLRVMEPFQGMGIGTALIQQAERIMRDHHLNYVSIAVARTNPQARRLYERLGYHVYTEDEGRWSYTNHENVMVEVHEPCWMLEKAL